MTKRSANMRPADERTPLDAYYTDPAVAMACVAVLPALIDGVLVEPSVGGGAFARAMRARWPGRQIVGVDVVETPPGAVDCDACQRCDWPSWGPFTPVAAIVGNPPYSHAEAHIRHALAVVRPGGTVAFLLRLAMLEGQKRAAFWREFPPVAVHVLSKRPSFTGGGTDSAAYAVFQWRRGFCGTPTLGWI